MARNDGSIDPTKIGTYHCHNKCAQGAYLLGKDNATGQDFSHRKLWILIRLRILAALFAIEVHDYNILCTHFHLLLRNRPDIVAKWTDEEVIRRAIALFPEKFRKLGVGKKGPRPEQIKRFIADREMMEDLRLRFSDPSWFMRMLCQHVSQKANGESEREGHFWAHPFKCVQVLDIRAYFTESMYIALNQVRAGMVDLPEASNFSSFQDRFRAIQVRANGEDGEEAHRDDFLCPLVAEGDGRRLAGTTRISDTGLLECRMDTYIDLLDRTGREVRKGKRGSIPNDATPILKRFGIQPESWVAYMGQESSWFPTVIGGPNSITDWCSGVGRKSVPGFEYAILLFA